MSGSTSGLGSVPDGRVQLGMIRARVELAWGPSPDLGSPLTDQPLDQQRQMLSTI